MFQRNRIEVSTKGRGCYEISNVVNAMVKESGVSTGVCNLFIRHTSASLMISENADPAVLRDLEAFMERLVPDGDARYTHTDEGPDDMPAHLRSILTQSDLNVPVENGQLQLGTWQGIYSWEHRYAAHSRTVLLSVYGE